jgi:hypothetical protein
MKINFKQVLKDLDGNEIKIRTGEKEEKTSTLGLVSANALLAELQGENLSGVSKIKNYELAVIVYSAKDTDLTAEEIVLIKERIAKIYGALIVGQTSKMLEGKK